MHAETHASNLSIEPRTEYRDDKQVFVGTEVSRTVDATFDNWDKLRAFIALVPADKEVQINSMNAHRSDIGEIKLRLRKAAIENSRQAAGKIANAYGPKLEGVYSVSEVAPNFAYGVQAGSWQSPGALQEATVTGSRMPPPQVREIAADLRVGTMTIQQDIYAVYLTAAM